jgi:hypothetical protein
MNGALTWLAWLVGISIALALVAFLLLKWIALRLAKRVAESAEQQLTAAIQQGLAHSGMGLHTSIDRERRERYLAQIDRLAWLTDRAVPLPIVGGVGLDAVLGLVPVVGDIVALCISSTIVLRAAQLGASQELISRLVAIQCTDLALGAIPIVGDLVDVAYQGNVRSSQLIRQSMTDELRAASVRNS